MRRLRSAGPRSAYLRVASGAARMAQAAISRPPWPGQDVRAARALLRAPGGRNRPGGRAGGQHQGRAANSWLRRSLDRRRVLRYGQDDREGDPLAPGLSAGFGLGRVFLGRADRVRVSDGASSFPVRAGPGLGPRTPSPSVLVHHGTGLAGGPIGRRPGWWTRATKGVAPLPRYRWRRSFGPPSRRRRTSVLLSPPSPCAPRVGAITPLPLRCWPMQTRSSCICASADSRPARLARRVPVSCTPSLHSRARPARCRFPSGASSGSSHATQTPVPQPLLR